MLETPGRIYGVAGLEVDERPLPVAWGRLVSVAHDDGNPTSAPAWTMDLETISFGRLATQDYVVRITLKDGRTLAGDAVLASTNGRVFHFESRGDWTDLREGAPHLG